MNYYLYLNEQQVGPYTEEQIRELVAAGTVAQTDLCWHEGLTEWQPLNTILGFVQVAAPPPQPQPIAVNIPQQGPTVVTVKHEVTANVKQGAVIGGWVCFVLGVGAMYLSMWSFVIYGPLFLVAFILSIIAMSQRRVIGGISLLLATLVIPSILGLFLFSFRTTKMIQDTAEQIKAKELKAKTVATATPLAANRNAAEATSAKAKAATPAPSPVV